jgi:hypothetical protein
LKITSGIDTPCMGWVRGCLLSGLANLAGGWITLPHP